MQTRVCGVQELFTIACQDEEFIIISKIVYHDIRVGSDYLLLGREVGTLLEFKVANST